MFQVRIHDRGGQGVVTAAELLAVAAFAEGRHAQAFPSFGSERTGAPVAAFCRVDDPIRTHEPITAPDAVVVADPSVRRPRRGRPGRRGMVATTPPKAAQRGQHHRVGGPPPCSAVDRPLLGRKREVRHAPLHR